jgi:hypothetical protein
LKCSIRCRPFLIVQRVFGDKRSGGQANRLGRTITQVIDDEHNKDAEGVMENVTYIKKDENDTCLLDCQQRFY